MPSLPLQPVAIKGLLSQESREGVRRYAAASAVIRRANSAKIPSAVSAPAPAVDRANYAVVRPPPLERAAVKSATTGSGSPGAGKVRALASSFEAGKAPHRDGEESYV